MNKSTFSSSVILASLLVFTVFFVEAAPVPGSLEPPPIPPNGFIPAIFSKDLLFSLLCNIQLLHIRYIGLNEYRYNSATEKGAGHQYASFDRSIDGGNTSAPLVFLRLLQEFPEFLGTHDNLLIIVKLHHTFCLLDSKMIAPVRADFITIHVSLALITQCLWPSRTAHRAAARAAPRAAADCGAPLQRSPLQKHMYTSLRLYLT